MTPDECNLTHKPMDAGEPGTRQAIMEAHQAVLASRNLPLWVVTNNPSDLPGHYVARLGFSNATGFYMTMISVVSFGLAALRDTLPPGLIRFARHADDEPQIVETWL